MVLSKLSLKILLATNKLSPYYRRIPNLNGVFLKSFANISQNMVREFLVTIQSNSIGAWFLFLDLPFKGK